MPLKVVNSLTKQKEEFKSGKPGAVKMYVCGPTVYDEPHIGHLRSAYVFDVMRRYLESSFGGYKVTFVRNVTDVDDKIIEKAKQLYPASTDTNAAAKDVATTYLKSYHDDLNKLGILAPTHEPKATENIKEMIALIALLINKGVAYPSEGDVYYSVAQFPSYGKLSGQNQKMMIDNTRIDKNEKKRDPLDFALWKKAKEGEPSWQSPWSAGRPGWHIECSAMNKRCLGETIDIHGGGRDLIFPHHENEIAQSEGSSGKPFAKYWIHHGLLMVDGQKMSKSLGNFITLTTLEEKYKTLHWNVDWLKIVFLSTHYSAPIDITDEKFEMAKSVYDKFTNFFSFAYRARQSSASRIVPKNDTSSPTALHLKEAVRQAMDDDFNTPLVLSAFHEAIHESWKSKDMSVVQEISKVLLDLGKLFGLFEDISQRGDSRIAPTAEDLAIDAKIQERTEAKKVKNFKLADEIRDQLKKDLGVEIMDLKDGSSVWRKS